jgi:EmrB/QacA subfamily drug resistance transporter
MIVNTFDTSSAGIRLGTAHARWVLAAVVGASGLTLVDATAVNVALPAIGTDLQARVAGLQWTVNAYTLSLASLILLAGSLGDLYGRKLLFQIGIVWFALASLLCASAPTPGALIGARALQGVGGALLTPGSLAIIQASFAAGDRARAIGMWSGLGGIAAAIGPLLGGWLVGVASWRALFWVNLPVAAAVVWVTARHVPESRAVRTADKGTGFDISGAVLGALGLGALTWALIAAGEMGLSSAVFAAGATGVFALIAFLFVERSARAPLVPLELFASRQFTGVNMVTFVVYGGMAGLFFLLVVYLQQVAGYPPLLAGTALTPVTLLMLLLSSRAGALAERIGPRRPMTIGPLVMAAGMLLLSQIGQDASYVTDVLPGAVLFGLGLSATVAPLTATALASADPENSGIASGVNNAVARTAALLAVAVFPIAAGLTGDAFNDPVRFARGFVIAMRISAASVAAGGLLSWLTIRDEIPSGASACDRRKVARHTFCAVDGPPVEPKLEMQTSNGHPYPHLDA